VPTLVDKYFSSFDLKAIEDAVRKAESGTSGELVVTITPRSRRWLWERIEIASVIGAVAMLISLWITRTSDWGMYYNFSQSLLWGIIGFALAYFVSKPILMRQERTRKIVWKHALDHFRILTPTRGRTGVLIFVSVAEHQAAVVADTGIASRLSADYWDIPHRMIGDAMRHGKHAEGIIAAVDSIGAELARHFPRENDDINELPDSVTIDKD
jgi:putative membrane protein